MKKITLFAIFLFTLTINAQDPNILWQRTIGGSGPDLITVLNPTSDNGMIIGGFSGSDISGEKNENNIGVYDIWIIKLGSSQNIEWQNTIGGTIDDRAYSVFETTDGGYLIGGVSTSDASGDKSEDCLGYVDYWVVKLNGTGAVEWENTIGGGEIGGTDYEILESVIQTSDGGYILAGYSDNDISGDKTENSKGFADYWIVKLTSTGSIQWQKTIGGSSYDALYQIAHTDDGGFILIGSSDSNISGDKTENSNGGTDFWIIKFDTLNNIQWQKTIGGENFDEGYRILQTNDGGYILGGTSNSNISGDKTENSYGGWDYWIIKLNNLGNIEWQKTIGGADDDSFRTISKTSDGGYMVSGYSNSNISGIKTENSLGEEDYWTIKLDEAGNIEWQNTIGGSGSDGLSASFCDADGNFIFGGYSNSDVSGDKSENSRGDYDFWIIKHAQILGIEENLFATAITLYPNPAKNTLQLNTQDQTIDQINIYTITGSKVLQLDVDTISPTVDVSGLAAGVYYVQMYSGKNVALKKFVKE